MDDLHLKINNRYDYLEAKVIELELKLKVNESIIEGLEDENKNKNNLIAEKNKILSELERDYRELLQELRARDSKIVSQAIEIQELRKDIDDLLAQNMELQETLDNLEKGFFL